MGITQVLSSADSLVRELAAQVLGLLASAQQGVDAMLLAGTVELLKAMQDSVAATRHYAHTTLQKVGELPAGREAIVSAGGTAMLVAVCKAQATPDALLSLKTCLRDPQGLSDALETKAIGVMVSALKSKDQYVLQHALKNIAFLTNPDAAKKEAIQEGAISPVCRLLQHDEWPVRAAAAGAVGSLALDIEGKKTSLRRRGSRVSDYLVARQKSACGAPQCPGTCCDPGVQAAGLEHTTGGRISSRL